eukprot:5993610-Pleurochrysis_carterae.AAC.5
MIDKKLLANKSRVIEETVRLVTEVLQFVCAALNWLRGRRSTPPWVTTKAWLMACVKTPKRT